MKYSYYPGCTIGTTAVEYGLSTDAVCEALGIELIELEDWNCCGASSAHSLNHELALALPARNVALAQTAELDTIVPCPACYQHSLAADKRFHEDEGWRAETEELLGFEYTGQARPRHLLEVLGVDLSADALAAKVAKPLRGLKVACYYGCALVRHPKVTQLDEPENPQYLDRLMSALGATPVDWSFKTDCCGADLALTHGNAVVKLVNKIVGMAQEAGAQCLVCSCGLCQINLEMRQDVDALGLPVFYFTELMGIAFGLAGAQWWSKHMISPSTLLDSLTLQ